MNRTTLTAEVTAEVIAQPLTHQEIDRRIGDVTQQVLTLPLEPLDATGRPAGDDLQPHWIPASELVRRMRPFMVYN